MRTFHFYRLLQALETPLTPNNGNSKETDNAIMVKGDIEESMDASSQSEIKTNEIGSENGSESTHPPEGFELDSQVSRRTYSLV